jgi:Holliday junction DNA helicase RuvA
VVREDAQILYGFGGREEREIFRMLISVSGVGTNTARLILSSLSPQEISQAILAGNVSLLQGIKGIGAKSAQRIIIDLKDKLGKGAGIDELFFSQDNTSREEALSALVALGFQKKTIDKTVTRILSEQPELSVEEVVKAALKFM